MWERGDKTNQGIPELNGSSVGIAKVPESDMNIAEMCNALNLKDHKKQVLMCLLFRQLLRL